MQNHYQQIAPATLIQASRVMQLHGQTLIISADNGAVAAKLRQISPEMMSAFEARGIQVTGIQIRVQVRSRIAPVIPPRRTVGNKGKKELENLVLNLQESPLRNALRRLAKR